MSTYLELVNAVLVRLREDEVTTVSANAYSKLIGKFVNDAKRQVEDAWNWEVLQTTLPVITAAGTSEYTLTGSGRRFKDVTVHDITNNAILHNVPMKWIEQQQQIAEVQNAQPVYFGWSGFDGTDTKIELYPTPDGTYTLNFNLTVPQVALSADADNLSVPDEPVVLGAYARALVERGEDGGLMSNEAYGLFKGSLADHIALEAGRNVENDAWVAC